MIKQVSWVLEWIFLINYLFKNDLCPCPWRKIGIKTENMINEDKWKISTNQKSWKIDFDECSKYCLGRPLMKNIIKSEKGIDQFWWMFEISFWWAPFYLRNIFFVSQILRALLSNKMEFCIFEKVNNSIATELCANLLNTRKKQKKIILVHNKIQRLNCVVHYLNIKII